MLCTPSNATKEQRYRKSAPQRGESCIADTRSPDGT